MNYYYAIDSDLYLSHHGIKDQKWGVRRYQNPDGSLTTEGRIHYGISNKVNHRDAKKLIKKKNKLNNLKYEQNEASKWYDKMRDEEKDASKKYKEAIKKYNEATNNDESQKHKLIESIQRKSLESELSGAVYNTEWASNDLKRINEKIDKQINKINKEVDRLVKKYKDTSINNLKE